MKSSELYQIMIQNGVENEKKAKSILTWHEGFALVVTVTVCNILCVLADVLAKISISLPNLLFAVIAIFVARKYVFDNATNVPKLMKTYSMSKKGTLVSIIALVAVMALYILFIAKK